MGQGVGALTRYGVPRCPWKRAGHLTRGMKDPVFRITFARIVTHNYHPRAWLADRELLRDGHHLSGIPGVLIQGRLDLGSPPDTAWQQSQAWPGGVASGRRGSRRW